MLKVPRKQRESTCKREGQERKAPHISTVTSQGGALFASQTWVHSMRYVLFISVSELQAGERERSRLLRWFQAAEIRKQHSDGHQQVV